MDEEYNESDKVYALWESLSDESHTFERIPEEDRPCSSPDVCAFLFLDKRFPPDRKIDMVCSAEHDQIWLRVEPEQVAELTEADVLYLTRCGVFYDDDVDSLSMFV